jgi:hypothetical protein
MKVLFLFGEICSGKSTYEPEGKSVRLTVSNVVKKLMQSEDREVLQKTKHMDTMIANEIANDLWHYDTFIFESKDTTPDYLIIDGIRQATILTVLESYIQRSHPNWSVEYKWLEVDREERKRRFDARKDHKDTLSFDEAEKRDNELGLSNLFRILKEQNKI